jgi:4-amino-4-deoxy-L-arabinose transferase-like glycosyltransferase
MLYNFNHYWPKVWLVKDFFVVSGDTHGYYDPVENFYNGQGYNSACRMPGLLPLYYPLRLLFSPDVTKILIILLQFFTSVISVRVLALIAKRIFNDAVYTFTLVVYALSTFVSIWDHYGYSDSFSISFLILSIYLALRYKDSNQMKFLLFSGIFFCWSLFFRPINIIVLPVLIFHLVHFRFNAKAIFHFIKASFIFVLPLLICLSAWAYHNYKLTSRFILLQDSMENCYQTAYPVYYQKLRDLSTAWGGDYQRTTKNGEMNWFLDKSVDYKKQNPFSERMYASNYTIDSLIKLRESYHAILSDTVSAEERSAYIRYVSERSDAYKAQYKKEHSFDFMFLNRARLAVKFCFPMRLDNLPFPKLSEMSLLQKLVKTFYLVLLHLVNLFGLLAGVLLLFRSRKNKEQLLFYGFPFVFLLVLGGLLGFIEMRYFAPIYPFFLIFTGDIFIRVFRKFKKTPTTI